MACAPCIERAKRMKEQLEQQIYGKRDTAVIQDKPQTSYDDNHTLNSVNSQYLEMKKKLHGLNHQALINNKE